MLKVKFFRNILLLAVLIAFSLPLYEAFFIHPSYRNMLIEQTEQEAARYGNYLINTLGLKKQMLQRHGIPVDMARDVGVVRKDRLLVKLRVFSPAGEIIFSTQDDEVGVVNQKDYFVNVVAKGKKFSKVVKKDSLTADGSPTKIDVVETYVPIMGTFGFHGAIEVYYDISQALSELDVLALRSSLMLMIIALGLLAALILSLERAYASHRAQQQSEEKLVEINEKLEQRVIARTRALKTSNRELQAEIKQHLFTTSALKKANDFNRTVINSMSDAVAIVDVATHQVVDCNSVFLGDDEVQEAFRGRNCSGQGKGCESSDAACETVCPLSETVQTGVSAAAEHQYSDSEGRAKYVEVTTSPIFDETGKVVQAVHVWRDITQRKLAQDEIMQMAYYDALTGLPNRRMLLDRLQKAIPQAQRKDEKLALLFLDLDRFKDINDSRGHSCGDQILRAVAEQLEKLIRSSDTLARLGGDEFVFLLTKVETERDIGIVAEKILATIREPIQLEECQVHITTSIGISVFPTDGEDSEVLLKGADMALYAAKSIGRDVYKFYSGKMNAQAQERHELESRMHQALEKGEFSLVYQPQIDLSSGAVVGVEALARWQNPTLGEISPGRFIPVAEESGLIQPLGDWVFIEACRQAKKWFDRDGKGCCVAVNISARQFQQPDFVAKIQSVLKETGLPAYLLDLELTESLLMQNVEANIEVLRQLKGLGLRLSIDDFGTGYSSLSYLKNFPIDRIKIDRSFVRDINVDENDRVIVETIIAMADRLGLEVIAEGVETEAQLAALQVRNCHLIQGHVYARPIPPAELDAYIENGHSLNAEQFSQPL